jgi:peptidoglycan hydrolase-like protein with peptidoglycan-binding domain
VTNGERTVLITASLPVLRRGSEGQAVTRLQALLNVATQAGLAVDGFFGPLTEAAVRSFRRHVICWSTGSSAPRLSPATVMGPRFRQWHGTTSGSTSTDLRDHRRCRRDGQGRRSGGC